MLMLMPPDNELMPTTCNATPHINHEQQQQLVERHQRWSLHELGLLCREFTVLVHDLGVGVLQCLVCVPRFATLPSAAPQREKSALRRRRYTPPGGQA